MNKNIDLKIKIFVIPPKWFLLVKCVSKKCGHFPERSTLPRSVHLPGPLWLSEGLFFWDYPCCLVSCALELLFYRMTSGPLRIVFSILVRKNEGNTGDGIILARKTRRMQRRKLSSILVIKRSSPRFLLFSNFPKNSN